MLRSASDRPAICLDGYLDAAKLSEGVRRIEKRLGSRRSRPVLIVSSEGGSADAAMSIAETLGDYDVVVREKCLSACANYLFLPARKKAILRGSEVGWHGGGIRTRIEYEEYWNVNRGRILSAFGDRFSEAELKEKYWQEILRDGDREERLLNSPKSNVIDVIYWYSKARDCAPQEARQLVFPHFWRPSLRELDEVFGVKFVSAESPEDYAYPMIFTQSKPVMRWRLDSACLYDE
jgi:hypothetical protein